MLAAALLFSSMVAFIKLLGSRLPSYEIVFFRSLVQLVSMTAVFWRIGFTSLKTERPLLQGLRALIAVALINCNFYAFTKLPMADVTAIGFSRNLFLIVLAVVILHEKLNLSRLLVTLAGFVGILLITRPGGEHIGNAAWVALAGAALGATMMIMIRKLTFCDSNMVMMAYPAVAIFLATILPTWLNWVAPTPAEFLLLLMMSYTGIFGQWCMIQAFRLGETTAVAPASYIRIVFAALMGFYLFAEVPDLLTLSGAMVIIISNLILIYQERHPPLCPPPPGGSTDIA